MRLFVLGLGYTPMALIRRHGQLFSAVAGTVRTEAKAARLRKEGFNALVFGEGTVDSQVSTEIERADLLLSAIPPGPDRDPVLEMLAAPIAAAPRLSWIGYLSTIGVYGDHGGAWVSEETPCAPADGRSRQRLSAERAWLDLGRRSGKAVHIFRLAGIYGPGRSALTNLAAGTARRIVKPGQVFNRIHVEDIAEVLMASSAKPRPCAIYNVADDEPAPPQDVVTYAASLLGVEPPPELAFDRASLSPMASSFYAENKRASNRLMKDELGIALRYPTYREGLRALYLDGEGSQAA